LIADAAVEDSSIDIDTRPEKEDILSPSVAALAHMSASSRAFRKRVTQLTQDLRELRLAPRPGYAGA
jgi:hypothetical protein